MIFCTEYHYNLHINKAVPCGTVFSCDKCEKKFTDKKRYDLHMLRKTPCIKDKNESKPKVDKVELEKIKSKLRIKEIAEKEKIKLKAKINLEKEKIRIKKIAKNKLEEKRERKSKAKKEQDKQDKIEILRLKLENTIHLKEMEEKIKSENINQYISGMKELSEIKANTKQMDVQYKIAAFDARAHLENMKTERKMLPPKILEEKRIQESRKKFVDHIKHNYLDKCVVGINNMKDLANIKLRKLYAIHRDGRKPKRLYNLYDKQNDTEYIQTLLAVCFRNPELPEQHSLFYNGLTDEYYGIDVENVDESSDSDIDSMINSLHNYVRKIRTIDFDRDVMPIFSVFLSDINKILMQHDINDMRKYARNGFINSNHIKPAYRDIAKPIFEIDGFENINKTADNKLSYSLIEETEAEFEQRYLTYHKDTYKENNTTHDYSTDNPDYKKYIAELKHSGYYITY